MLADEPAYPQTDIWSVAILAYIMLSGTSPFRGVDESETKANISSCRFRFESLYHEVTPEVSRFFMFIFKRTPLWVLQKEDNFQKAEFVRKFQETPSRRRMLRTPMVISNRLHDQEARTRRVPRRQNQALLRRISLGEGSRGEEARVSDQHTTQRSITPTAP